MTRRLVRACGLLATSVVLLLATGWVLSPGENRFSPIHFAYQPIDFRLDSSETAKRHAPETMAGGVAVFDSNNDGHPDIFFTNGADIDPDPQ